MGAGQARKAHALAWPSGPPTILKPSFSSHDARGKHLGPSPLARFKRGKRALHSRSAPQEVVGNGTYHKNTVERNRPPISHFALVCVRSSVRLPVSARHHEGVPDLKMRRQKQRFPEHVGVSLNRRTAQVACLLTRHPPATFDLQHGGK